MHEENELMRRAYAAYFRAGGETQPDRSASYVVHADDRPRYVVLRLPHMTGVLAVYRVRNDGVLKRLRRWPKALEGY